MRNMVLQVEAEAAAIAREADRLALQKKLKREKIAKAMAMEEPSWCADPSK
jgi:hypothetical protein